MKRLVVFCFCLLFGVLSALSILNFDGEAVGAMEGKIEQNDDCETARYGQHIFSLRRLTTH